MRYVAVVSLSVFTIGLTGCSEVTDPFAEDYKRFRAIQKGFTEAEVKERLGLPQQVHERGVPPSAYCPEGYSCEKRRITGKLFIYFGAEPVAYIYFDQHNRVEHLYVGGS
jgi:hypothetical protein